MPKKKTGKKRRTRVVRHKKTSAKKTPRVSSKIRVAKKKSAKPKKTLKTAVSVIDIKKRAKRAFVDVEMVKGFVDKWTPPDFKVEVRRPDDLLVCDITFKNLKLDGNNPPALVRKQEKRSTVMIVEFPPQSFGEEAYLDATGEEVGSDSNPQENKFPEASKMPDYPKKNKTASEPAEDVPSLAGTRVRMAGKSRVAYVMPSAEASWPFSINGVLSAMGSWKMRLDINAAPDFTPTLAKPGQFDRKWLREYVIKNSALKENTKKVIEALEASGARRIGRPLLRSARKVSDIAIRALGRRNTRGLSLLIKRAMRTEVMALSERFPELRKPEERAAALLAISYEASKNLAVSKSRFNLDVGVISKIPFLPVVLMPHEPAKDETSLEIPYRLILSPTASARWSHKNIPVFHNNRAELWHTRLTTSNNDTGPDSASRVRALWSPDYEYHSPANQALLLKLLKDINPFRMSLDPLDRIMLVQLMAGYNEPKYRPKSSQANRLMLSSMGGLLDVEGSWDSRPGLVSLEQWRHLATLGRDHYVRVVYAGFLCPFGHAASLIKVTERKFENHGSSSKRIAVLRQRFFIVVREQSKDFTGAGHQYKGRNFPFKTVEILTRVTPNLLAPEKAACTLTAKSGSTIYTGQVPPRAAFWPMVSNSHDFQFDVAVTDISGIRNTLSVPLLFVGTEANAIKANEVVEAYNLQATMERRRTSLDGATVCYAPVDLNAKGDPRLPTETMVFAATVPSVGANRPKHYPEVEKAEVGIRAVQRLMGRSDALVEVQYPQVYKTHGIGGSGNKGELFLEALQGFSLEFGAGAGQSKSDALGGLVSPAMVIQGLSRKMGPVDDLTNVAKDKFNPAQFFGNADPKILGGIRLLDLLSAITGLNKASVPKMLSREFPDRVEASYHWSTNITNSQTKLFEPIGNSTKLTLDTKIVSYLNNPSATEFSSKGELVHFKVNLFSFVIVWFDKLKFEASQGGKPDVTVEFHPGDEAITFGGPLEFVNELRSLIPSGIFSDSPAISVTPSGISAGYSLNLPSIGVGVFTLSNASLGARFSLPFDSKPAMVRFNFSERQSPFSLTVSMLGGGGFFAIAVGAEGVQEIEAALEFGAAVSISLGVASGGVEIKAGVYFHWQQSSGDGVVELAGYVRLHGELSVLGLISASLTFNLQLAYLKQGNESLVWGEATLVVEIDLFIFSADVSIKCRREFAGCESDPKFIELIPDQHTWSTYCDAFAKEVA